MYADAITLDVKPHVADLTIERSKKMTKSEIATFIEKMEEIGDSWTEEEVEDAYGDSTLDEALADRRSSVGKLTDIISKVLNR